MNTKSILVTKFGGYNSLRVQQHPLKEITENDVQVEVHYCGLNFADLYTRQGMMPKKLPFVLGIECSGIITDIGKSVKQFKVGDSVVCYDYTGGLFRNKVVLSEKKCYKIPEHITLKEAVALFVNYLTAYFSVVELGNLKTNQCILIHSCAGGVGWAATQLSNLTEGITVFGTTSDVKSVAVKKNGVHYVLEYDTYKDTIGEICPDGLDLIIDNQAGDHFKKNLLLLKPLGKLVLTGANNLIKHKHQLTEEDFNNVESHISATDLVMNNIGLFGLHLGVIAEKNPSLIQNIFEKLCSLLLQKKISFNIDSTWPFEKILEATKLLQERKNVGKVLLYTDNVVNEV